MKYDKAGHSVCTAVQYLCNLCRPWNRHTRARYLTFLVPLSSCNMCLDLTDVATNISKGFIFSCSFLRMLSTVVVDANQLGFACLFIGHEQWGSIRAIPGRHSAKDYSTWKTRTTVLALHSITCLNLCICTKYMLVG